MALDTIYYSNIQAYAQEEKRLDLFYHALTHLQKASSDSTFFIDSLLDPPRLGSSWALKQRVRTHFAALDLKKELPKVPTKLDYVKAGLL